MYDNNSTNRTVAFARAAEATISYESLQRKGHGVRSMFRDITADYYVMVGRDDTSPAEYVHELLETVLEGKAHICVGSRLDSFAEGSFRSMHQVGNELIRHLINFQFKAELRDILSGHRASDAFSSNQSRS